MNYLDVIYGNRVKTDYPDKLAKYFSKRLGYHTGCQTLLDLGCGTGTMTKAFRDIGYKVTGIDKEPSNYTNCWGVNFESDILPWKNEFDIVFCKSIIEHIKNTDWFLDQIYKVLKPGGTVIILTPDWSHNYRQFYDDYTHVKPFCRKGLQDALKIHNFQDVNVEFFYHLPFIWKYPFLKFVTSLIQLLPDSWKWTDKEETQHRILIRFSKEVNLLAIGQKP